MEAPWCRRSARRGDGGRPGLRPRAMPRPKASPPRSSSEAAPPIRVRSLPPGRPSEGSSPHRPATGMPAADRASSWRSPALAAITVIVSALLLATGEPKLSLATTRTTPAGHQPISRPQRKRSRPHRVDPAAARHRRARLRHMAVVEVGPLATTHRAGLAVDCCALAYPPSHDVFMSLPTNERREEPARLDAKSSRPAASGARFGWAGFVVVAWHRRTGGGVRWRVLRSGRRHSRSNDHHDPCITRTERKHDQRRPNQHRARLRPVHAHPRRTELPRTLFSADTARTSRSTQARESTRTLPSTPLPTRHASTCCRTTAPPPLDRRSLPSNRPTTSKRPHACARTESKTSPTRPSRTAPSPSEAGRSSTRTPPNTGARSTTCQKLIPAGLPYSSSSGP